VRLSLATKIFLGFSALLGSFTLLALLSVREIRGVAEELRALKDGNLAIARLAAQLETQQQNRFRDLRRALEEPDPESQEVVLRIAMAYFPDVVRATLRDLERVALAQASAARARQGPGTRGKAGFYARIQERTTRIAEQHEAVDELTRLLMQRVQQRESPAELLRRLEELEVALRTEAYQLDKFINDETDRAVRRAESDERAAIWRVLVMTSAALVIGVLMTLLAARALAPIRRLVQYSRAISRGDYGHPLDVAGHDELAILADELRAVARSRKDREDALDRQAAELEQAYRRVEELKRYHESIVRSLRTAVVVTDRELGVTSTNRAAETHWGLEPSAIRGRRLEELELGQALSARLGSLTELVRRAETGSVEALQLGSLLADATLAPLLGERGEVLGLVVALEDVTDAVRTKEALLRSERLATIGRMSAHVTHEVRNPLSSIGLNAELLEDLTGKLEADSRDAEEARALCRAIVREVDRLSAITEEYLRFARLPRPELRESDLAELLGTIAAFVRRDCEAAGVAIELDVPADLPRVVVDPDQLRQALFNLVRNAKESMPEGGRLVLGAAREDAHVAVFVRDEGVGIPAAQLERIFDPFYSTKLTGTGLGLAMVQQIVNEHGGQIRVKSEEGRGTEFRVLLNLGQPPKIAVFLATEGAPAAEPHT
jgi:nitrogen fixation/metabolism regulation signal transduction histidine kinase